MTETIIRLVKRSLFKNTGERINNHELILQKIVEKLDDMEARMLALEVQADVIIRRTTKCE